MPQTSAKELLSMDLHEIVEAVQTGLRSVGAEVSSPWFYLQFGLILAAAGIAWAADAAIRSRVDMSSLAMRWPLPLRHFARVMVFSASTAIFAILMIVSRVVMYHATWPSRSYLIAVAAKLALAWLAIRLITSVIRNAFIVRAVSLAAWTVAALSIIRSEERRVGKGCRNGCAPDPRRSNRSAAEGCLTRAI